MCFVEHFTAFNALQEEHPACKNMNDVVLA